LHATVFFDNVDSKPTALTAYPFEQDLVIQNHTVVKELAELLQLYRKNVCFVKETIFFRPGCEIIQQMMDVNTSRPDTEETPNITGNMIAESMLESSKHHEWWVSTAFDDSLKQTLMDVVPDRHYVNHHVFVFSDIDITAIFEVLVKSGVLDQSVPNVMFLLGVQIRSRPFGMVQVKVLVGHVCDLLAKDLVQLNKL
jgi:hypothetical protein